MFCNLFVDVLVCLSVQAEGADIVADRLTAYRAALETLYQQHRYPASFVDDEA